MIKIGSHFSGIGSVNEALKKFGLNGTVEYSIEYEPTTQQAYKSVYGTKHVYGDISKVNPKELPPVDLICTSPPCQSYSIQGSRKSVEDERGKILFETFRLIEYQKPKMVLFENVANLKNIDNGKVLELILNLFELMGYRTKYKILNSLNYNSAQSRERLFIVAFDKKEKINWKFPQKQRLTHKVKDIVCKELDNVDHLEPQYIKKLFPIKRGRFLTQSHERTNSTYEIDTRIYRPFVSHTLLCRESSFFRFNCGTTRTLTIKERFRLQAFTEDTIKKYLELELSRKKYLTFTGNCINVNVMGALLKRIIGTFEKFENRYHTSQKTYNVVYDYGLHYIDKYLIRDYGKMAIPVNLDLKEKQSMAAKQSNKKRIEKSKQHIQKTIKTLKNSGLKVNQYNIIKHSKLNKLTVKKYLGQIIEENQETLFL